LTKPPGWANCWKLITTIRAEFYTEALGAGVVLLWWVWPPKAGMWRDLWPG
jgi:hypothetical protein